MRDRSVSVTSSARHAQPEPGMKDEPVAARVGVAIMDESTVGLEPPAKQTFSSQPSWLNQAGRYQSRYLLWACLAPLLAGLLFIVQAWWLAQLIDHTLTHTTLTSPPLASTWWQALLTQPFIGAVMGLIVLRAVLLWSGDRAASRATEAIKQRLRQQLFNEWLARGPAWARQHPSGELSTSLLDYVEALEGYLQRYMAAAVAAVVLPLVLALMAFGVDWIIGLLFLVTAPLIPFFMALIGWRAQAANDAHHVRLQRLAGLFGDRVQGLFTLRLFGQAPAESARVRAASEALSQTTMKVLRIAFMSSAVLELFAALGVAGVAVYVGLGYLGLLSGFSGLSLQQGLFCLLLAPEVYQPLRQLAASYHDRAQAKSAVEQLQGIYDGVPTLGAPLPSPYRLVAQPLPRSEGGASEAPLTEPSILVANDQPSHEAEPAQSGCVVQIKDWAVYTPTGTVLVQVPELTVLEGDWIALEGPSGSGKSTLLESLVGLRPSQAATHQVFGEVTLIRAQPYLGRGTVAECLRFARAEATEDQLWHALERVQLAEHVRQLPHGLSSVLGTRGYGWSGGQLHRLALARLFLTDPHLVLLDEPTAHLDASTRDQVLDAILDFCAHRSLIIATHDPAVSARLKRYWRIQQQRLQQEAS